MYIEGRTKKISFKIDILLEKFYPVISFKFHNIFILKLICQFYFLFVTTLYIIFIIYITYILYIILNYKYF